MKIQAKHNKPSISPACANVFNPAPYPPQHKKERPFFPLSFFPSIAPVAAAQQLPAPGAGAKKDVVLRHIAGARRQRFAKGRDGLHNAVK